MLNAQTALANGGHVTIYDSTGTGQPATPDVAVTTQVALVTLPLQATAAAAASGGSATMNTPTATAATASGNATWFRVYTSGGAAVWDGSVGTSGADMNFSSTIAFVNGIVYGITAWTVGEPTGQ